MATTFIESGSNATYSTGFWPLSNSATSSVVQFHTGSHSVRMAYTSGSPGYVGKRTILSDSGSRGSFYFLFDTLPTADKIITPFEVATAADSTCFGLTLKTTGALAIYDSSVAIQATGSTVLSINTWYRISFAYTITNGTTNSIAVYLNGVSEVTASNITVNTSSDTLYIGTVETTPTSNGANYLSDIYIDNNSSGDPGDIRVTAKRPFSNGTANNFVTQIGAGGSGYGTGHAPQVNERPLSATNGWSVVAVGATTEEYNIESAHFDRLLKEDGSNLLQENGSFLYVEGSTQSDVDISGMTIIDYAGWINYKTVLSETPSIVLNGVNTAFTSTTNTQSFFTKIAGSTTYPTGTGTDIGMISDATATTVSLYECGVVFAYTATSAAPTVSPIQEFMLLGVGT